MRKIIVLVSFILVLIFSNYKIYHYEKLLTEGKLLLLQLAPVDPRSIMQGDYMALRFDVVSKGFTTENLEQLPSDGYMIVELDKNNVGSFIRFDDNFENLKQNEARIRYRIRNGKPKFATNAFFFQEGHAELYTTAAYGEFRLNDSGEILLAGLRDKNFTLLGQVSK